MSLRPHAIREVTPGNGGSNSKLVSLLLSEERIKVF